MWDCRLADGIPRLGTNKQRSLLRQTKIELLHWNSDVKLVDPLLVLKKGCLHKAKLGYTPLVEVNQAIIAWSY